MVKRLKAEGYWVRGVDLNEHEYCPNQADEFVIGDLRDPVVCKKFMDPNMNDIYQLWADMGGAGFVFVGDNGSAIMHNSAMINLNIAEKSFKKKVGEVFYSSSACIYPERNQLDPDNPNCAEDTAFPADSDSENGWEKLFSERIYMSYVRNRGMEIHIARLHSIFGPEGSWNDGCEKAPAAVCRKVAEGPQDGGEMEMWGDGEQTRSFCVDERLDGVECLMNSSLLGPVNIGSDEMVTINALAGMAMCIAGKKLSIRHVDGPLGVRGRNSDNRLIEEKLGWRPSRTLKEGMASTYRWIAEQVGRTGKQ